MRTNLHFPKHHALSPLLYLLWLKSAGHQSFIVNWVYCTLAWLENTHFTLLNFFPQIYLKSVNRTHYNRKGDCRHFVHNTELHMTP